MPDRIQLRRTKGWRMPDNTVSVTRGPRRVFGNPFKVKDMRELGYRASDEALAAACVMAFRAWLAGSSRDWMGKESDAARSAALARLPDLRGKNLACWCPPGAPCHADVLLEIANAP